MASGVELGTTASFCDPAGERSSMPVQVNRFCNLVALFASWTVNCGIWHVTSIGRKVPSLLVLQNGQLRPTGRNT